MRSEISHGRTYPGGGTESGYRGWAGVVIEVAPNQYAIYEMQQAEGSITVERDSEIVYSDPLMARYVPGPPMITIELKGSAMSHTSTERPAWRVSQAEIGS